MTTNRQQDKQNGTTKYRGVAEIAAAKALDPAWLRSELGLADDPQGGILIPYLGEEGTTLFRRERGTLRCKDRFYQPRGTPLALYGLWRIDQCRRQGHAWICEGESDTWALWAADLPALGIPGKDAARVLTPEALDGISDLYLLPDNQPAGDAERMLGSVGKQLAGIAWEGRLWRIVVPAAFKDVSDWRASAPPRFKEELNRALADRVRVEAHADVTQSKAPAAAKGKKVLKLPAYRPFPLSALPPTLREYVDASASAIGCDPALVALPALAVVAGCIGNSRGVRLRRRWIEPAIIWAITVAPSGAHKSPAFACAVRPLVEIQMDAADKHVGAEEEHAAELKAWRSQPKGERGEEPEPPKAEPCFLTADTTIESIGHLLRHNPRGLLVARDELDAWFQSMTRYKSAGAKSTDRPHWLELAQAGWLRISRVSRPTLSVRRACCSVTGTIQPIVLAECLDPQALAAGLAARFLMSMPPRRPRRWTESEVADDLQNRYEALLRGLLALKLDNESQRKPHLLRLAPDAKQTFVSWFNEWGEKQDAAFDAEAATLAKLEGYAARLALLHHVITHVVFEMDDQRDIATGSIEAGICLAEWFAAEAVRVYGVIRETEGERQQRTIIEWIAGRGGRTTAKQLRDCCRARYPQTDDAEAALIALEEAQVGTWGWRPAGPQGGRPTRVFQLAALETPESCGETEVSSAASERNGHCREPGEEG